MTWNAEMINTRTGRRSNLVHVLSLLPPVVERFSTVRRRIARVNGRGPDSVTAMQRVLIAGLGDTGVLTAIKLARDFEVTGVSVKPGLLSGQELGVRLARPADWARDY